MSKNNRVQCDKLNTREYSCEWVDGSGNTVEEQVDSASGVVAEAAAEAAAKAAAEAAGIASSDAIEQALANIDYTKYNNPEYKSLEPESK